jgi:ABC-type uncharacterized transport system permease subunit
LVKKKEMIKMEENKINALAYLSGGLGIVSILGGIFGLYPILYGLIGALILGVISGALKRSWTAILGSTGLIVLLTGIFGLYPFTYALLGAVVIWVIGGSLKIYLGEDKPGKSQT